MKRFILVLAVMLVSAMVLASTASANVSSGGCTAGPYRPTFSALGNGLYESDYVVHVGCSGNQNWYLEWQLQQQFGSNWAVVRTGNNSATAVSWDRTYGSQWEDGQWWNGLPGHTNFRTVIKWFAVNGGANVGDGGCGTCWDGSDSWYSTTP